MVLFGCSCWCVSIALCNCSILVPKARALSSRACIIIGSMGSMDGCSVRLLWSEWLGSTKLIMVCSCCRLSCGRVSCS